MPEAVSAASSDDRHDHDAVAEAGADSGGTPEAGRFAVRVLIVDDDATTGRTMARILTIEGFEASSVQSGAEGLQRALSGACDVLVLDLHLLDLPGLTVLAELRASGSDLPVVPITGHYLDEEHRRRAEALGVSAFLYKPLIDDELAQALRRATGLRSQGPAGSIGDDRRGTDEILESVLLEAERRVRPAYPRMPREAVVDAVHDAAIERAARGDLHTMPRTSLVARIAAAAWRNMANAWRGEKRRRIREETYARLVAAGEAAHERDADYVAVRRPALLACAETDAERRAVLLWLVDAPSDAIAGALGCSHLPPAERDAAVNRFKDRLAKRARRGEGSRGRLRLGRPPIVSRG